MRWHEITEAPIADLAYAGDVPSKDDKHGVHYVKADDHAIVTTPKGVAKIMNAFERTPYVFNIYVAPNRARGVQHELVDVERLLGRKVETNGRITVIYTNNVTGSYRMPMTGWTLAHRMIHAIQVSGQPSLIEMACWKAIVDIWNLARHESRAPKVKYKGQPLYMTTDAHLLSEFSSILFTMRSARKGYLKVDLDVGGELLAQYLLTGRVKLVRSEEWDMRRPDLYKPSTHFHPGLIKVNRDHYAINRRIEQAEQEINEACEQQLAALVGKVIKF